MVATAGALDTEIVGFYQRVDFACRALQRLYRQLELSPRRSTYADLLIGPPARMFRTIK